MQITLYHKKFPEGRVFDQDSGREAQRVGWFEENKKDIAKETEIIEDIEKSVSFETVSEVKTDVSIQNSKRPRKRRTVTSKRSKSKRNADGG